MGKSSETVNVPSAHAFTQNIFGVLIASIKAWFNDGQSYDTVSFFLSELWRWEIGVIDDLDTIFILVFWLEIIW